MYVSPVADVISQHGVKYHQYADDTQLCLSMRADNTAAGLAVLAACTADVRQWYMQNDLQLNLDKSEALVIGTTNQLHATTSPVTTVSVAGVNLPVADELKVLGVVLDKRLSLDSQRHRWPGRVTTTSGPPDTSVIYYTDDRPGCDTGLQPDTVPSGLLQLQYIQPHHLISAATSSLDNQLVNFDLLLSLYSESRLPELTLPIELSASQLLLFGILCLRTLSIVVHLSLVSKLD